MPRYVYLLFIRDLTAKFQGTGFTASHVGWISKIIKCFKMFYSNDVYERIDSSFYKNFTMDWVSWFNENGKSIKLTYITDRMLESTCI